MAIPFLSNINLNGNQALNLALHNKTTPPSNPTVGQIYFDTSENGVTDANDGKVLVYNGSQWVSIAGDIQSVGTTTSNQLTVTNGTGPDVSLAIQTGAVADGGTALATGDQIYDFVTGLGYVESVAGGTYLTNSGTATAVVLNHDDTSRTDTTSTDTPAYGGTFEAVTSVTTNAQGHVTAVDVSTVTIPASDDTTYDLNVQAGGANTSVIRLAGNDATNDDVTISGTSTTVKVTESGNTITLDLQDDVTIASQLVVGNTGASEDPIIHSKTGGTGDNILLESTNTGAGSAPDLTLYRNAGIPSDNDTLGVVAFRGRNFPNNGDNTYNGIYSRIIDASQQHSALTFSAYYGSSTAHVMGIHNTADNSSSGKVIINPANFYSVPTATLDVNGDADISSNLDVGGNLTVVGNLTVEGTTTIVESTTVTMTDNILQLNVAAAGDTQVNPTDYSGIEVVRASNDNRQLVWNESTDKWQIETSTDTYENIATAGDIPTVNNGTLTVQGSNGLTGSGTFTANDSTSPTITISHADTSSQASVNNSGVTAIQDVTLDTYGHVTGLASVDLTSGINSLIDTKISATGYAATITDTATITHSLGTDVIIQLYDITTGETVYADVDRISSTQATITFASTPTNSIRVLVQQIN